LQALQALAHELDLQDKVYFLGFINRLNLCHYFAAADLFLFSSTTETQGLVTLEAMAAGLPVVAVDASGTSESVVDQITGYLCPPEVAHFSERAVEILLDASLRKSMARAGKDRTRAFCADRMAKHVSNLYEELVQARCSNRSSWKDRLFGRRRIAPISKTTSDIEA
jgi:1,2-diacylglycerol 3-alpha-glucosyltransferase